MNKPPTLTRTGDSKTLHLMTVKCVNGDVARLNRTDRQGDTCKQTLRCSVVRTSSGCKALPLSPVRMTKTNSGRLKSKQTVSTSAFVNTCRRRHIGIGNLLFETLCTAFTVYNRRYKMDTMLSKIVAAKEHFLKKILSRCAHTSPVQR